MKKGLLCFVLVFVLMLAVLTTGCGKKEEPISTNDQKNEEKSEKKEESKPKKVFKLRFSTASVPNDAHTKALYVFKEEIEKSTNGAIKVEIFHSSSLFKQEAELPALMKGNLDMCYTSAAWLSEHVPFLTMLSAGYIFKDYDHMVKVLNGEIGKEIFDRVAREIGVRPLAAFYLGSRQINLRDIGVEVRKPEDLKGVKLRMPNSPAWLFLGEALGANPTPLSFSELYMALKTGTVDGQDNPLPTIKNAKFYEVTKTISLTRHVIDTVWPTINEKKWQEMGPELQEKMYTALEKARQACDKENLKAEEELIQFFKDQGMTIIEPDIEAFRSHVQKKYLENKEMTSKWDMDLYEKIQALAE